MRITIVYFSQTGNTRKIAEAMSGRFEQAGHTAQCIPISEAKPEHFLKIDILGVGTPTFESHAPSVVKQWIKSLPLLTGRRSFVFATCGGAAGNVLSDLTKLLRRKGATVTDRFLSLGEVHHPAPCIQGKSACRPNEGDLTDAERFVVELLTSDHGTPRDGLLPRKGFYNLVGKISSSEALIRMLEPKPQWHPPLCKHCKRCVQECPVGNLTLDGSLIHDSRCIRCYRCVNVCPHRSYTIDWRLGNLIVLTLWNRHFMRWFGEYENESR